MSTPPALRLGTRRSALATTQSQTVADAITAATGRTVELVEVTTLGDTSREHLTQIGGTGVFIGALREALAAHDVDAAVHSLKDLPTAQPGEVLIAAVPPREDPRDALVARDGLTLGELPVGSTVGTGSPRRVAQLHALGLGLDLVGVRGNIDSRIGKVRSGELDAVVLARAGLARIDRLDVVTEVLDPLQVLPAPGQGALAVEVRRGDEDLVRALDHPETRAAVEAERHVLALLEAGCSAPLGARAVVDAGLLLLSASVYSLDGATVLTSSHAGVWPDDGDVSLDIAEGVARELIDAGAAGLTGARP